MGPNYQQTFADRHFLGRLSEELSDLIARQSEALMKQKDIVIPPKSCSLIVAIAQHQPASARALADTLARSHQLISQKLPKLVNLNLIEGVPNPLDKREKLYRLTDHGQRQVELFRRLQPNLESVYAELFAEIGDVSALLRAAIDALGERPLSSRIAAQVS